MQLLSLACLQVTRSVSNVLADIKAKHDAATRVLAAAGQDISSSQTEMGMLRTVQQAKLEQIKTLRRQAS